MNAYFIRPLTVIISLVLLTNCSGKPDAIGEMIDPANFTETTHKLSEVLIIQEDDNFFFGQISTVQPTSRGHILVGDITAKKFHIFDQNGNRIGEIGKEGSGPGEFQQMGTSVLTTGDTLMVMDWSNARITAFTQENPGKWARNYDIPVARTPGGNLSGFFHLAGEPLIGLYQTFVMPASAGGTDDPPKPSLGVFNRAGERVGDPIASLRNTDTKINMGTNFVTVYSIPYGRSGQVRDSEKALHVANTEHFGALTINVQGDTLAFFQHPVVTRPVTEEMIVTLTQGANTEYYQAVRESIPDTRPAFDSFMTDNKGNVYFRFDNVSEDEHLWLMFTQDGEFQKSFKIIKSATIRRIKNDQIYCSGDIDGEPIVVVYQIDEA
jgi:hypothetical protein